MITAQPHPLYRQFEHNTLLWGHYYFPHHFRQPTPPFHVEILRAAQIYYHLAIAAPREFSKSTLLTFLDPFHDIFFKKRRFILICQNTFTKAAASLDAMKKELSSNDALRASFPGLVITKDASGDSEFRHADGFTTKILCKGYDQIGSVRGIKFGAYRPDKIICDDLEDDELVRSPDRRQQLIEEHDEALVPAGDRERCQQIRIGTLLHDDCLIARLVSKTHYPEYHKLFYQALLHPDTPHQRSLWPEKWPLDRLLALRAAKPTVFAKEYQNDPASASNTRFQRKDFRYFRVENDRVVLLHPDSTIAAVHALRDCRAAIACDLAWKEKRDADYTVVLPGLLTPTADILVMPYWVEHGVRPDQFSSYIFTLEARLRALTNSIVPIGFEKAMLEQVTKWALKKEMRRRNQPLITTDLEWDADKITRVEIRVQPVLSQHMLYFQTGMGELEYQLERFPYGTKDDIADALQGLIQILQNPKKIKASPSQEDQFMKLRQHHISQKRSKLRPTYTGRKHLKISIPHTISHVG